MASRTRASYIARVDHCLEQLSCPVCFEQFDSNTHKPLVLPECGHTLCQYCCQRLRDDRCPQDNCPIRNRTNLKPNYQFLQLLEAVATLRAGSSMPRAHSRNPLLAAAGDAQYIPGEHVMLQHRLGSGSAGDVWKAKLRSREAPVAVKMFNVHLQSPSSSSSPVAPTDLLMRVFMREVEVLMAVANRTQRCVSLIGCTIVNDSPCIIIQLYPNGHLKVPQCGFPLKQALEWGLSIALALKEVHALSIVVADLKPGNILVDEQQRAVLTDFGLSRKLTTTLAAGHGNTLFGGTAGYMAPEQSRSSQLTTKADSWAWACVMVQLLTGQQPWSHLPDTQVYDMLSQGRVAPRAPAGIPNGLARLLESCWQVSPAGRPSADELVARLQDNMAEWAASPMLPSTPPRDHSSSDPAGRAQSAPAAAQEPGKPGLFGKLKRALGRSSMENATRSSNSQPQQSFQGRSMSDWITQLGSDSSSKQEDAAHALARFTYGTTTATNHIRHEGGIAVLVTVLTDSSSSANRGLFSNRSSGSRSSTAEARRWAAATLANMLRDDRDCALEVLCQGAVPPLMLLMYSTDEASARYAVWALKRLAAAGDACRDALAQLDLVQPAVELLLCSEDQQTRVQAAQLLRELCQSGPLVQQEVQQAGVYSSSGGVTFEVKLQSISSSCGDTELQDAVRGLQAALQRVHVF